MVNGMEIAERTVRRISSTRGKIAQQTRSAVALHHFVHRAAEIDIDDIEPHILANAGGIGHHRRIGSEQLRRNGMLFGFESQIAKGTGGLAWLRRTRRLHANW